jgi:hypothetical protein
LDSLIIVGSLTVSLLLKVPFNKEVSKFD